MISTLRANSGHRTLTRGSVESAAGFHASLGAERDAAAHDRCGDPRALSELSALGVRGFVHVDESLYAAERAPSAEAALELLA